jgi:hypothetical protein
MLECDSYIQSVLSARSATSTGINVIPTRVSVISPRTRLISNPRVWFWETKVILTRMRVNMARDFYMLECDSNMQSVISARSMISIGTSVILTRRVWFWHVWVWFWHPECNFYTHCDFNTHKCDYDILTLVVSTRTRVISTRRVWFWHEWVWFALTSVIATRTSVISTRTRLISTRRIWFWHVRVWFWY